MNNKSINGVSQRRWLIGGLAVAALAAVLWAAYRPRPLVVETATVAEGRFEQVIEEDGRLRLQQRYTVTAPTAAVAKAPAAKTWPRSSAPSTKGRCSASAWR